MNEARNKGDSVTKGLPTTYAVVGPSGDAITGFDCALSAAAWAKRTWPHLEHDPDRTGTGWDVEAVR